MTVALARQAAAVAITTKKSRHFRLKHRFINLYYPHQMEQFAESVCTYERLFFVSFSCFCHLIDQSRSEWYCLLHTHCSSFIMHFFDEIAFFANDNYINFYRSFKQNKFQFPFSLSLFCSRTYSLCTTIDDVCMQSTLLLFLIRNQYSHVVIHSIIFFA